MRVFPGHQRAHLEAGEEGACGVLTRGIQEVLTAAQMIDYDAARARLRKLIDKPSEDPQRLPRAQAENDETKEVRSLAMHRRSS